MVIKFMRDAGMPIEQLARYIAMTRSDDDTIEVRKNLLCELRNRLTERIDKLQTTLWLLSEKIERYETHVASEEKNFFREHSRR